MKGSTKRKHRWAAGQLGNARITYLYLRRGIMPGLSTDLYDRMLSRAIDAEIREKGYKLPPVPEPETEY